MIFFDYFVLIVMGLSVAVGSMRGAIKEVMDVATWFIAFWSANYFSSSIHKYLPSFIPGDNVKIIVAFVIIAVITYIVMGLLSSFLSEFIKVIYLGWLDKLLGVVFGITRALVIIVAVTLLIGLTSYPKTNDWQNGTFTMPVEALTVSILPMLPQFIQNRVKFDQNTPPASVK